MTDTEITEAIQMAQTRLRNPVTKVQDRRLLKALVHLATVNEQQRKRLTLLERINGGAK